MYCPLIYPACSVNVITVVCVDLFTNHCSLRNSPAHCMCLCTCLLALDLWTVVYSCGLLKPVFLTELWSCDWFLSTGPDNWQSWKTLLCLVKCILEKKSKIIQEYANVFLKKNTQKIICIPF